MITRIFFALIGMIVIALVFNQVKKGKLSEKESFFWMMAAIGVLVLSIFPRMIDKVSNILHIDYPPSLLFLIGIIFILGLVFRLTIYITLLKEQNKELAQRNALLEKRILKLEQRINGKS